jgi:histidinol-phosphatase (PHP family)
MERTCAQAVALGLPALAFTEHVDRESWRVLDADLEGHDHYRALVSAGNVLSPPLLDVAGYHESLQRCRALFPDLTILSGVELGEPHWHPDATRQLLAEGQFDLTLGSIHGLMVDGEFSEMPNLFRTTPASEVILAYLQELANLIETSNTFQVLAHIDYPVRYWPTEAGAFDPGQFEAEFRGVLRLLAASGRALELNTRIPFRSEFLVWWRQSGGRELTFGSDAHSPEQLAHDFADAAQLAEVNGFRPGRYPHEFWKSAAQ